MTSRAESFAEVATRRDPDKPLIPDSETPHTAIDYKTSIAAALGFGDQRYSGSLSRPLIERLYIILFGELPDQSRNLHKLKYEIAVEIGIENAERLRETHNVAYKRDDLIRIYSALKEYTHGDVQSIIEGFDLCPVCDSPVDSRTRIDSSGRIIPPEEYKVCLYREGTEIIIVEHVTSSGD